VHSSIAKECEPLHIFAGKKKKKKKKTEKKCL